MMGKRKIICTLLAVCLLSIATQAQDKDTLAAAEHLHHWNQVMAPSQRNPAFLQSAFASSITQAGLNASYKHANQAFIAQRGDGHTL